MELKKSLFILIFFIILLIIVYKLIKLFVEYKKLKSALKYSAQNNLFCTKFTPPCDITINNNLLVPTNITPQYDPYISRFCIDLISRIIAIYLPPKLQTLQVHPQLKLLKVLIYSPGKYPIMGYVSQDANNNMWIVYRGSLDKADIKQDFIYKQTDLIVPFTHNENIRCHQGFMNVYRTFREQIINEVKKVNPNKIIITGHSLGSGLATITSYELGRMGYNVYTYTLASPRAGNIDFSNEVTAITKCFYRIVNLSDLVPTLPIAVMPNMTNTSKPFIYKHAGKVIEFDQNWKSIENNHMIYNYRHYIELQL